MQLSALGDKFPLGFLRTRHAVAQASDQLQDDFGGEGEGSWVASLQEWLALTLQERRLTHPMCRRPTRAAQIGCFLSSSSRLSRPIWTELRAKNRHGRRSVSSNRSTAVEGQTARIWVELKPHDKPKYIYFSLPPRPVHLPTHRTCLCVGVSLYGKSADCRIAFAEGFLCQSSQ